MKLFKYFLLIISSSLFSCATKAQTASRKDTLGEGIDYIYKGKDSQIIKAIDNAKLVLANKDFYEGIKVKKTFKYTNEPAEEIATALAKAKLIVRVREYKGGDDTRTLAFVDKDFPTTIFINASKTDERQNHKITNTLIHETIHILDRSIPEARFGHGGNSSNGKKNSAPYWIGAYASKIILNDVPSTNKSAQVLKSSAEVLKSRVLADPEDVVGEGDLVHLEETESMSDENIDNLETK